MSPFPCHWAVLFGVLVDVQIGGKKFDMRIYVVVTSFKPLKVYMSRLGFGRFCNVKYSAEVGELCNEFMHLTNVAIQQHGEDYNEQHGNKWPLELMRLYLEGTRGVEAADRLFADIEGVILKSLRACQNIIVNDRHCFELYGYDIIVDENLKPWLIEVNASPSLTTTTQADRLLKHRVISDTINIITPPDWLAVTDPAALPPEMRDMDNTESAACASSATRAKTFSATKPRSRPERRWPPRPWWRRRRPWRAPPLSRRPPHLSLEVAAAMGPPPQKVQHFPARQRLPPPLQRQSRHGTRGSTQRTHTAADGAGPPWGYPQGRATPLGQCPQPVLVPPPQVPPGRGHGRPQHVS
ncbi:hypothetical protein Vretifemale_699 [Volvox reticuliferus]|uniref:Tubulin--tyrosine ligase-like protein 9 n=1 Tax=Volvox reticuliferus TaxID=1737510 RepID=A0A8J4C1N3_9CHLO|nr:hypothetical protein Vretifemale_699 [Volvox reticuliferus]